jgi:hypothetical protein
VDIGEGQLGSGVGSFAADGDAHAGGPAVGGLVWQHAGQLGDAGAFTQAPSGSAPREGPGVLGQDQDGLPAASVIVNPTDLVKEHLPAADASYFSDMALALAGTAGLDRETALAYLAEFGAGHTAAGS